MDDNDDAMLPPEMVKEDRMGEMTRYANEVNARIKVYPPSVSGGWT